MAHGTIFGALTHAIDQYNIGWLDEIRQFEKNRNESNDHQPYAGYILLNSEGIYEYDISPSVDCTWSFDKWHNGPIFSYCLLDCLVSESLKDNIKSYCGELNNNWMVLQQKDIKSQQKQST